MSNSDTTPAANEVKASSASASALVESVKSAVRVKDSEIKRWRRTFEHNAVVVDGVKYVSSLALCASCPPRHPLYHRG